MSLEYREDVCKWWQYFYFPWTTPLKTLWSSIASAYFGETFLIVFIPLSRSVSGLVHCFWQGALSCANSVSLWRSALMQWTGTQACRTEMHALSLPPLLSHLSLFHPSLAPLIQSFPTLFSINIFLSHVFQAVLFKQFTPLTFGLTQTRIYRLTLPGTEPDAHSLLNTDYKHTHRCTMRAKFFSVNV